MSARDERGFTLAETIISLAIAGMMVAIFTLAISQITTITSEGNKELTMQVELQNVAAWLHRDAMEADTVRWITNTQIALTKYESLDEATHTITTTRTITYTVVGAELIREDSASPSPAMTIASNVECVRFQILPGGEEVMTDVLRGAPVRAVVASHLPGMESRSAILDIDMRADGPLEIPASYTATIPAPEVIATDDFSSGWSGGEGWAWDSWAYRGDAEVVSGYARLGHSRQIRTRSCFWWFLGWWCGGWSYSEELPYIVRQVTMPDCTTDLVIELDAKVENFEGSDVARLLAGPDGIHWETAQTWSENTGGFQPYEIPVHQGGTVCDLYTKFETDVHCDQWEATWVCDQTKCHGSNCTCVKQHKDCLASDAYFYVDNIEISGR